MIDKILFIKTKGEVFPIIQVYANDIVFGATNNHLCQEFSNLMSKDFDLSVLGELNFFLRLQIKQCQDRIFINQSQYFKELLKKFKLHEVKHASARMALSTKLDLTKVEPRTLVYGTQRWRLQSHWILRCRLY